MIINSFKAPVIAFRSNQADIKPRTFDEVPSLNPKYTEPEHAEKTVTMLGSSRSSDQIAEFMRKAQITANKLVKRGYNVLTGCGDSGIMGASYKGAHEAEITQPKGKMKPGENLAIVVKPAWGDENLEDCRAIGIADSETERIQKFQKASNNFLIFPGGTTTLQEATTLITGNVYPKKGEPRKNIFLVGSEFFKGLKEQYDQIYKAGILKAKPEELFKVVDSPDEILKEFPAKK